MVDKVFDNYHISGTAIWLTEQKELTDLSIEEPKRVYFALAVNFRTLQEKYWENFKYNLVRQCILSIIKDVKPASEHEVTYFTEQEGLSAE